MISLLVATAWKGSLLVLLALAAALALHRSSAAVRHAVWTAAIAAVLLIAPLSVLLPPMPVRAPEAVRAVLTPDPLPHPPTRHTAEPAPAPQLHASTPPIRSFGTPLLILWLAGAAAFAICFLVAALHLARAAGGSAPIDDPAIESLARLAAKRLGVPPDRVALRWSERDATPMTWGLFRPTLILPVACRSWDEQRLLQVFIHEIGHVRRWDVLTQALSSAACALYWFNPLVWFAARQMLVERERACDDLVLESGAKPSDYAHELLEIARSLGARWTAARVSPAMARRSQISGRLLAVLDPDRARHGVGRPAAIATAVLAAALVLPLAALGPQSRFATVSAPDDRSAFAAIAERHKQWEDAIRRRDPDAIAQFYTADALLVTQGRPDARGRQAIADLQRFYFDTGMGAAQIHIDELYPVGDMICVIGHSEALTAGGATLAAARHMTLWKKEEGQWKAHRDYIARQ